MNTGTNDFRGSRSQLPPDAFGIPPVEPEQSPDDIVDEPTWRSIMSLPGDVSLRTSDHFGTVLRAMKDLWGSVVDLFADPLDAWSISAFDVSDGLQAAAFNSLCGYYRTAASCLRLAVESAVAGTFLHLEKTAEELAFWQSGNELVKFGAACARLSKNRRVAPIEHFLHQKHHYSIFAQRTHRNDLGWAISLFNELSEFSHSRPTHSESALWEGSNGPVFVPKSLSRLFTLHLDTTALVYVTAKLCRPQIGRPAAAAWFYASDEYRTSEIGRVCLEHLFLNEP